MNYILATVWNGKTYYINFQKHYDWADTYDPTTDISKATQWKTRDEALVALNSFNVVSYDSSIPRMAWKICKLELKPVLPEVK